MKLRIALAVLAGTAAAAGWAKPAAPGYQIVSSTVIGGDGGWDAIELDSAGRLYIGRSAVVQVFDTAKHALVGTIPQTGGVHDIAFDPALGRGYVSNGADNTVAVFDTKTLKPAGSIPVGRGPDIMMFDPATKRVFSFNGGTNDTTAIDTATGKVAGTLALGGKPEFAVPDGKGTVYVNLEDTSEIVAFDAKALTVKKRWSLAPGDGPTGLAIDHVHDRLFSACANGMMVVSDPKAGKVVATPAIGNGADGLAFDSKTGLAFSPNGRDGTLTVIHEDSPDKYSVVETAKTEPGARTMALDTKNGHVFLVTAKPDPAPPAPGANPRRRRFLAGSFAVLEVVRK
ncbi:MAG TPA: YncE family protein [Armatimonadota bacterium]|jgi:YVTN family beta-propeller protein